MKIQALFGGEALLVIDRTTKKIDALFTVLGEGGLERSIEMIELTGGNYQGAVKTEPGLPSNSFSAVVRQISNGMFRVLENAEITESAADSDGYVSPARNVVGTSLAERITPSIIADKKANLPYGKVFVEITSETKCKIIVQGSMVKGPVGWLEEDGTVIDDVAISVGGTVVVNDLGLSFTVSSGAVLVAGDSFVVEVRPANTNGSASIKVGGSSGVQEKEIMIVYPRQTDGSIYRARIPRVAMQGVGLPFTERAFAETTINGKPLIDPVEQCLYVLDYIKATA